MVDVTHAEFSVTLEQSLTFARLSGDYNPLHVDPVAARRLRFGGTVTHGIHLLLCAFEEIAARGMLNGQQPVAVSATFDNPVPTASNVTLQLDLMGARVRLSGQVDGRIAFKGTLEMQPTRGPTGYIPDSEFERADPQELGFPPAIPDGEAPLKLSRELLRRLFPALATMSDVAWIADLLATTQVVGMQCPGMHSIYSGLKLRRMGVPSNRATLQYRVEGTEKRFQLLRIQVSGATLAGSMEAFLRPRPVAQRSTKEIATVVSRDAFAGDRVLVIGGSRGLGEVTAKIVSAGGGDVTITYARGLEDAARVCEEAHALGLRCTAHQLDVFTEARTAPLWLAPAQFSHVYFFASPTITPNAGPWSDKLFRQFAQVYVTSFASVVEQVLAARANQRERVRFLYPSSIFVVRPEAGFVEYAVAKAAGEALCDQLQGRRGAHFAKPRLPRMRTDQTSALVDIGALDPLSVMLEVVREFHS